MIVRNESGVILRCLESVKEFIDCAVIVDTGSTDGTPDVIRDFFYENAIPLEIHHCPWVDFGYNRSEAIELAKGKAEFLFIIDADEILKGTPDLSVMDGYDIGNATIDFGGVSYGRPAILRSSRPFYYDMPVHNVLKCKEAVKTTTVPDLTIKVFKDGATWKQGTKEKYLKHVELFLDYIRKNGEVPRAVFYLAQSYRDAGDHENAILWYRHRTTIEGGFEEERYVAQYWVAQLKWILKKSIMEVGDEFMRCCEFDTLRAEHLYQLKQMYEMNGRPQAAKQIGRLLKNYAGKNPYPKRTLFLNPNAYVENIPDFQEQAIV